MSNKIFSCPIIIRERHLDTFGHINNAKYLEIYEEARWEIISPRGFSVAEIPQKGCGPTILEIKINFLKEIKLRAEILIKTQLLSYEGKIGILKQWMEDSTGTVYCTAEFKIGLFHIGERKLILPTQEWLDAVGFQK